jgi:spermidine/putrescine transport system substrate-binding protein
VTFCLAVGLAGCGGGEPSGAAQEERGLSGSLTFFGYEDSLREEVMGPFEQRHPRLTVQKAPYSSGDEAITKLRGGFRADVVEVCVDYAERMARLGLLQPIDPGRIDAWSDLFPMLRDADGVRIGEEHWLVPTVGGTSGIVFDPRVIPEGIDSYRDLLTDPRLEGKVALEDNATLTIAVAALALGYEDPWALTDEDLERVKTFLVERKPMLRTLVKGDSDFLNLYRSGEIAAAFGYPDYELALRRENVPARFTFAEEGQLTWICGYGLGAQAQNLEAAYALLEWQAAPSVQAYFAKTYNYLVSNERTLELLDQRLVRRLGLDRPEQLKAAIPLRTPENYERWLEIWREFKAA